MNEHSYPWRVMYQRATRCWSAIFALCVGMFFSAGAQDKPIRLRNETISIPPAPQLAAAGQGTNDRAVSGLFLIQFTDRLQPAWRGELKAKGVELLQYVPDDAFVARLDNVRARDLRRLPYVRWVGDCVADGLSLKTQIASRPIGDP